MATLESMLAPEKVAALKALKAISKTVNNQQRDQPKVTVYKQITKADLVKTQQIIKE